MFIERDIDIYKKKWHRIRKPKYFKQTLMRTINSIRSAISEVDIEMPEIFVLSGFAILCCLNFWLLHIIIFS